MDVREQISAYLEDPETLYKEWHLKQIQYETGVYVGIPKGKLEDQTKAFSNWMKTNMSTLKEIICPSIDKIKSINQPISIVCSIMTLIEEQPFVGPVTEVATLLFLYGIEKLCKNYET